MPEPTTSGAAAVAPASTFDDQALRYDARAGLPSPVGTLVARSIIENTRAEPDDLVVEIGAGTGEIGLHLSRLPIQYVGLDASALMLRLFREKAVDPVPSLIQADCDRTWPLGDDVAAVIFASRVIHLLDAEHVTRETLRVARPVGFLILGRVLREHDGIKERLRRRRQELLLEAGITPRQGAAGMRRVIALCQDAGAASLGRQVVAEWTGETTPTNVIAGWESLSRMGSVPVDPVTHTSIVNEVKDWARVEVGDLNRPRAFRERYAIDVVRLP